MSVRRLVASLATLLVSLLCFLQPAAAAGAPDPAPAGYTYDDHNHAAARTHSAIERGPPSTYDRVTAYNAADRGSRSASARSDTTTPALAVITYDDPVPLVQVAGVRTTTPLATEGARGAHGSLHQAGVAANAGRHGADDALNGVRLRAQLTGEEIAGGHAFQKHVINQAEFPGITTRSQFAQHIEDVVSNGVMRPLSNGRSAYWQNGTVVIRNPNAVDGGTAFRPTSGYDYFLNLH